jgi:hypothetical protein
LSRCKSPNALSCELSPLGEQCLHPRWFSGDGRSFWVNLLQRFRVRAVERHVNDARLAVCVLLLNKCEVSRCLCGLSAQLSPCPSPHQSYESRDSYSSAVHSHLLQKERSSPIISASTSHCDEPHYQSSAPLMSLIINHDEGTFDEPHYQSSAPLMSLILQTVATLPAASTIPRGGAAISALLSALAAHFRLRFSFTGVMKSPPSSSGEVPTYTLVGGSYGIDICAKRNNNLGMNLNLGGLSKTARPARLPLMIEQATFLPFRCTILHLLLLAPLGLASSRPAPRGASGLFLSPTPYKHVIRCSQ